MEPRQTLEQAQVLPADNPAGEAQPGVTDVVFVNQRAQRLSLLPV